MIMQELDMTEAIHKLISQKTQNVKTTFYHRGCDVNKPTETHMLKQCSLLFSLR